MDNDFADEQELHEIIEYVLEHYPLSTAEQQSAAGIAKQLLARSLSSLSDKQLSLFNRVFGPLLRDRQAQLDAERRAYLMSKDSPP